MFSITHVKLFQKNLFELRRPSFFFHFLHSAREILSVFASKTFLFTRRRKKEKKTFFFPFLKYSYFLKPMCEAADGWSCLPRDPLVQRLPSAVFFFFQVKSRMKIRASSPKCSFFLVALVPLPIAVTVAIFRSNCHVKGYYVIITAS